MYIHPSLSSIVSLGRHSVSMLMTAFAKGNNFIFQRYNKLNGYCKKASVVHSPGDLKNLRVITSHGIREAPQICTYVLSHAQQMFAEYSPTVKISGQLT